MNIKGLLIRWLGLDLIQKENQASILAWASLLGRVEKLEAAKGKKR